MHDANMKVTNTDLTAQIQTMVNLLEDPPQLLLDPAAILAVTEIKRVIYRIISNVSFLFKVLENVVANCLHEHIYSEHLSNDLQSAYNRLHSTETALLKIQKLYSI